MGASCLHNYCDCLRIEMFLSSQGHACALYTPFRLLVDKSSRHFSAFVHHNNGNRVVEASTKEFCISRHLYKTSDCSAAYNIGRVIAHRCKSAGLNRVMWEHKWDRNHAKVGRVMILLCPFS